MRIGTVDGRLVLVTGPVDAGQVDAGQVVDVATASGGALGPDPLDGFDRWAELLACAPKLRNRAPTRAGRVRLGPPVPRPRQVFAVALNYPPHAAEAGYTPPDQPVVFTKFPSCITGPAATVALTGDRVDWEVELVAVIGRPAYQVSEASAWRYVAGLTVGQDLSDRARQLAGSQGGDGGRAGTLAQLSLAKSFPGAGPTGPVLVTPDELADPADLEISCALDQTTLQKARTSDMIFSVPQLVARLSAACRLLPGDLIFTGTPSGVGNRMSPPRYLRPGERLTSRIEGLGEITTDFSGMGAP